MWMATGLDVEGDARRVGSVDPGLEEASAWGMGGSTCTAAGC